MSTANLRARVAKLEKQRRHRRGDGYEPTEVEVARWIAYHVAHAGNQTGTEAQQAEGRRLAIMFARNGARAGVERSARLSNLLLRALVGEPSVTAAGEA